MKKQLLAGTAFVAAAMLVAGGAMAQDKMKKKMMTAFVAAAMLVAGGAMAQDKMKKKMMKPSISGERLLRGGRRRHPRRRAWTSASRTPPRST